MIRSRKPSTLVRLATMSALVVLLASMVDAQISIVVAKSSTQTASASELKLMFTGSKFNWPGGTKVVVVDQSESTVGRAFYEKFVGKSVSQVRSEWNKLVLSGQAIGPRKCASDEAVKKSVAENPNAVGFVATSALDESVKEIYRVSSFVKNE